MIKKAEVNSKFQYPIEQVWEIITNRENIIWRNDIKSFKKINEKEFEEININDLKTHYTIEEKIENKKYKLKFNNRLIDGKFEVDFNEIDKNTTNVRIYQENKMNNLSTIISSVLFLNLEKILNRYVYDLNRELKSRNVTKK
ncbi:hypothetical protein [Miniphocaeibacter halophilus]|uniref:Uncharacterized protein n=1 Tax=Miniphocaeibacter halophilus TaxID=2931922 RepID=A0AC61MZ12_9FIRM|nr:hypothetical protein [Miniphocaeibacter halophilus]QQK08464.1 hypothetical protein JFY71_02705 [Miniphocaeibacter halophilus]